VGTTGAIGTFHGGKTGSIPIGRASEIKDLAEISRRMPNGCPISGIGHIAQMKHPPGPPMTLANMYEQAYAASGLVFSHPWMLARGGEECPGC
jgi:hypothetical protein